MTFTPYRRQPGDFAETVLAKRLDAIEAHLSGEDRGRAVPDHASGPTRFDATQTPSGDHQEGLLSVGDQQGDLPTIPMPLYLTIRGRSYLCSTWGELQRLVRGGARITYVSNMQPEPARRFVPVEDGEAILFGKTPSQIKEQFGLTICRDVK